MSLRDLIDYAFRTLVDDVRGRGASLYEAQLEVTSWFDADDADVKQETERLAAQRNAQIMQGAARVGGRLPTPKRGRTKPMPEPAT